MRLGFEVRGKGVIIGYKLGFISGIYGWTYLGEVECMGGQALANLARLTCSQPVTNYQSAHNANHVNVE